jgi:hypothetical protein
MDTRNAVLDILVTFRGNAIYPDFREFINSHINWVSSLNSDAELYDPIKKESLRELKNFLKHPEAYLEDFIDLFEEYIDIIESFRSSELDDVCPSMSINDLFTEIVSELEMILYRIPPNDYETMKETNREFYHELNKYILNPERIKKMAGEYGIEFIDYLDAIDV